MGRVFLSYSHVNEAFVKDLYLRLTRDGVDCFFDKESIAWGANWIIELEKGIDTCSHIIIVLSPSYCQSEWSKLERTSSLADDPGGVKRKLLPLLLEPCRDLLPRFLKQIQFKDVSTPAKFDAVYPLICRTLGGTIIRESHPADRTRLPPISRLPDHNRMLYRSLGNGFIGRIKDLWKIHDILQARKTAIVEGVGIVMGMAGIGKTQLVIEYAHRFCIHYPGGVFWVNAEQGISTLIAQVAQGAGIDIDNTLTEQNQLIQLWKVLGQFQPVLIILDNFPENEYLHPWLPPASTIYTLVTTRRRDLTNYSRLPLECLTLEEGLLLLNKGIRKFGQEAGQLINILGGLPLALELAGNFLNLRPELTIEGLLSEMKSVGEMEALRIFAQKYANELPTGHIKEIAASFQLSWDIASDTARLVLQSMSVCAPAPVPRALLKKILEIPANNVLKDPVDETISELTHKLSLAELDQENDPWIHRLLAAFVKTICQDTVLYKKVVNTVINEMACVADEKDVKSYYELEKIVPHAETLLSSEFILPEQAIDLSNYLRWQNWKWGRYRIAEKFGRKSLALAEKHHMPGHPSIVISQSNLALVLKDLGQLEEARDLLYAALLTHQKNFEPGHPSLAISQSNLALVLKDLGQLEEARDILYAALENTQKNFEPGHPSITISQSNLALVLQDLGQLEEARDLLRAALEANQKSFEYGHPSIAGSQSNLAMVLKDLGQCEEAQGLLYAALESTQKNFKTGHPSIAIIQTNLAMVLKDLGQLDKARDLLYTALESKQKNFEPGHPSIAIIQTNLAMVLKDLGQLDKARKLAHLAYKSFLKKFGPEHPNTKTAEKNMESII